MARAVDHYLDADELKHLALNAMREGRHEDAIVTLKRAIDLAPSDAGLHYLLGAQYARIGFAERAATAIHQALALNPSLDGARFQLGWIYLNHGQTDAAAEIWQGHDQLGENHPLYLFKTGLLHLAKREYDECEKYLRRGIEVNTMDQALNYDMAGIVKQIQTYRTTAAAQKPAANTKAPNVESQARAEPRKAKPASPQATATPETAVERESPKTEATSTPELQTKPEAVAPKPKVLKNVALSAYQQNTQADTDSN